MGHLPHKIRGFFMDIPTTPPQHKCPWAGFTTQLQKFTTQALDWQISLSPEIERHLMVSSISIIAIGLLSLLAQKYILSACIISISLGTSIVGSYGLDVKQLQHISYMDLIQIITKQFSLRRCFSIITIASLIIIIFGLCLQGHLLLGGIGVCAFVSAIQHESFAASLSSLQEISTELKEIMDQSKTLTQTTNEIIQHDQERMNVQQNLTTQSAALNEEHAQLNKQQAAWINSLQTEVEGPLAVAKQLKEALSHINTSIESSGLPKLIGHLKLQAEELEKTIKSSSKFADMLRTQVSELQNTLTEMQDESKKSKEHAKQTTDTAQQGLSHVKQIQEALQALMNQMKNPKETNPE